MKPDDSWSHLKAFLLKYNLSCSHGMSALHLQDRINRPIMEPSAWPQLIHITMTTQFRFIFPLYAVKRRESSTLLLLTKKNEHVSLFITLFGSYRLIQQRHYWRTRQERLSVSRPGVAAAPNLWDLPFENHESVLFPRGERASGEVLVGFGCFLEHLHHQSVLLPPLFHPRRAGFWQVLMDVHRWRR